MNAQDERGEGGLEEVNMETLGEATDWTFVINKNNEKTAIPTRQLIYDVFLFFILLFLSRIFL